MASSRQTQPKPPEPPASTPTSFPDPIPGIIPFGTVTLFAGASGSGKSTMLDEWMVRWRDGRPICGQMTNRPTALYLLTADRPWADDHEHWFRLLEWPEVPYYALAEHALHATLRHQLAAHKLFVHCLDQLQPIPGSHVIVDPITPLFIAGNPNEQRPVAWTLLDMSRICVDRQINITCSAYFGKQKADKKDQYARPIDRIAGSGAFAGYSHCQVYITEPEPPEQPYYALGWKPRHGPEAEFSFVRNAQGLFVPFELYDELNKREAIYHCVPESDATAQEILQRIKGKTGLSIPQGERYLRELLRDSRIVKVRRGVYRRAKPN
jgi:AAA domain-containing protein